MIRLIGAATVSCLAVVGIIVFAIAGPLLTVFIRAAWRGRFARRVEVSGINAEWPNESAIRRACVEHMRECYFRLNDSRLAELRVGRDWTDAELERWAYGNNVAFGAARRVQ